MTAKLPKQADVDSQIMDMVNPFELALRLGCLASALIIFMAWIGLFGLMISGLIEWRGWPYIAIPVIAWIFLLGAPASWKARRGALATLDALATTAEAWLTRAGYSIDLNSDGYIGMVQAPQIEPIKTEVVKPAIWSSPNGVKLLAKDAPTTIPPVADQPTEDEEPAPAPTRVLWDLPGGVRCPVETIKNFVERIFIIGWGRDEWVGKEKPLDRETYDALLNLLGQAQIIEGRKPGYSGKLTIDDPQTALKVLNLS